jgi:acyl-CoA thioesterase YciA
VSDSTRAPEGEVLLRTIVMPADTNSNGDIFGGWFMAQMDSAGGTLAKEIAGGRVPAVAADSSKFMRPVSVGDTVSIHGRVERYGTTSLRIAPEVWVRRPVHSSDGAEREFPVTRAEFTYVAIDEHGRKRAYEKPATEAQR